MTMTPQELETPVYLAGRSRQGFVLGLDVWQFGTLVVAAAILLAFVGQLGPIGLLAAAPLYLPLGVGALITVHGMSAPRMAGLWLMRKARTAVGGNSQTYRPEQVVPRGTLNLPGVRASVQVWDVDDIACIYDPHARTLSIIARLEVNGFLMKNTGEKYTLAQQWGQVLSAFTKRPGVKRVTMQERTTPTTIRAAREHYEEMSARRDFTLPEELSTSYRQVLDQSERFAVAHQNYLTLTFDLVALQGQLKSLGGGRKAIQQLGVLEARNAGDALRAAGISVPKWLSSRDVGGLTRTAFDPEFLSTMQNRPDALAGVDLSAMGPMFLEEPANKAGIVRTDSGVHQTMWIHEWPRSASPVGFLEPVVFARHPASGAAVTHILSIVMTPVPVGKALKTIRDDKKIWRSNERMRTKRGSGGHIADEADWHALEQRESEIVAGHGVFRYGGYLTVTGRNEEDLEQAVAGMRNALSTAGMEAQILYNQQAEALMVNALPIGRGLT